MPAESYESPPVNRACVVAVPVRMVGLRCLETAGRRRQSFAVKFNRNNTFFIAYYMKILRMEAWSENVLLANNSTTQDFSLSEEENLLFITESGLIFKIHSVDRWIYPIHYERCMK